MLNEAFTYPTESEDWTGPFLIGSVLLLASFFVGITIIPLYGYLLKVLDAGRTGDRRLPEFDDWGEMIVDGIKVWVINFVYAGIPGLVFFIAGFLTFIGVFAGALNESGGFTVVALVVGGLVTLVAGLLWLVGTIAAPAAMAHMRAEDDFAAAFQVRTILRLATDGSYLTAILLAWLVVGVISTVGGMLAIILIGIPIIFFGSMVSFHLFGQGYQRAREAKLEPTRVSGGDGPA